MNEKSRTFAELDRNNARNIRKIADIQKKWQNFLSKLPKNRGHFQESTELLLKKYEKPRTFAEINRIFARIIQKSQTFSGIDRIFAENKQEKKDIFGRTRVFPNNDFQHNIQFCDNVQENDHISI